MPTHSKITWWIDSLLLITFFSVIFFLWLGSRPLFVPDEGRYAEIAREMFTSGNYITPYLNEIKYFEKPILFYWLGAAAIKIGGLNLWALRSVNAVLGLMGCLLTYIVTRQLYDRLTGLLAALILGTSALFFVMTHMISLDLPVTVFISASLYFFLLGIQSCTRYYFWGAAACAALAVLTKGLIGIVFPLMIIGVWISLTKQWKLLKQCYIPSSLFIFFIIAAPWHYIVNLYHPEFFHFYFIEQQFMRYTTNQIGHQEPAWFFIPYFIVGCFPWCFFMPQALFSAVKEVMGPHRSGYPTELFFLLWIILIFAFFSFSQSKLIPYILPVFPPLAILIAKYLRDRYAPHLIIIISICTGLFFALSLTLLAKHDHRSILPLAVTLKTMMQPQDDVIAYNQYYQDLPFYLERRVSILNWRNELTFGMQHQDTSAWMINEPTFWQRFHSHQRVFVVMSISEYNVLRHNHPEERLFILDKTKSNLLVSNKIN